MSVCDSAVPHTCYRYICSADSQAVCDVVKVKVAHSILVLSPELIPIYEEVGPQVACHEPGGRLRSFPLGLQLPSQPESLLASTKLYCLMTEAHV